MTEQELYNEYRKSDCKSFTDFLINKITELKKTYRKQRNKRIDDLQKENAELKDLLQREEMLLTSAEITAHNEGADKIALLKENAELKELVKNIIRVTWGEGWNYSLDWKAKAEQFLKDSEVEKL